MPIDITLQYFDGCPNWTDADKELQEVVAALGLDAKITYQVIESPTDAENVGFRGSPTILISGNDPFSNPDAPVGLSCRVYRTGKRPSGSPGVEALRRALRDAG